ncbi:MAG: hypothetical protein J6C39_01895 [Clostridia bacterium]|nr:hypothetical protein [Clostridia bacterium]MBO5206341.1 hypothetical protein [Clostridia bacterium]MBP3583323.1 hypothetical protein [Clostridia bacterium]
MKNRRFTIVAFLLVAVVAMSVGFAVVSHELQVGGNASLGPDTGFKVQFASPSLDTTTPDATTLADESKATIHIIENTEATKLQVTLASGAMTAAGQKATFKVTVKNTNTQHRAQLSDPQITYAPIASGSAETSDNHLTVTTSGIDSSTILGVNDAAEGGTDETTWTIVVTLDELPADTAELTFEISFYATAISKTH